MVGKAKGAGLEFDDAVLQRYAPAGDLQRVHDSLSFRYRAYASGVIRPIGDRHYVNQAVDVSATRLRACDRAYDPENLRRWAAGDPMQRPRPLRWWYSAPGMQCYYLNQDAELGCESPEA